MWVLLGYRRGWLHSVGHVRIGPTTRLAVNAGLLVGAAVGSLVGTDTGLVAPCGLDDTPGTVHNGSGKSEIDDDDDMSGGWTGGTDEVAADDEVSWQRRRVNSGCIARRIGGSYKGYGMLEAKGGGKVPEFAE